MTARTRPTLLDVGVAVFGGAAGIIANSRAEKSNAIPGVAIATALMPPLCTSAFGLATGRLDFFLGAFYLFFLNAVFIALSTYLVVQVLRFPHAEFRDRWQGVIWNRWIIGIVLVVLVPATWIFVDVIQHVNLNRRVGLFISQHVEDAHREVFSREIIETDSTQVIKLFVIGPPIPQDSIPKLREARKKSPYNLGKYELELVQTDLPLDAQDRLRAEIMQNVQQILEVNRRLEEERKAREAAQRQRKGGNVNFQQIQEEIHIQYPEALQVSYAHAYSANYDNPQVMLDTVPIFIVTWDDKLRPRDREEITAVLHQWLRIRINYPDVRLVSLTGKRKASQK